MSVNQERFVTRLCEAVGKERVLIHGPFHVQVKEGARRHDIWFNKNGGVKWKLAGNRNVANGSIEKMIAAITGYNVSDSALHQMTLAQELGATMQQAVDWAANHGIKKGVFCDAGFKNGRAKISTVRIEKDSVTVEIRYGSFDTSYAAEEFAIHFALTSSHNAHLTIYSDCKNAVDNLGYNRVVWIPREQNKAADKMANLRGQQ